MRVKDHHRRGNVVCFCNNAFFVACADYLLQKQNVCAEKVQKRFLFLGNRKCFPSKIMLCVCANREKMFLSQCFLICGGLCRSNESSNSLRVHER